MEEVHTDRAPESIGPFSQAIIDGGRIYVSGQGPIDPETNQVIDGSITDETEQTFENIEAILNAANRSLSDVLKSNVYMKKSEDYAEINQVYENFMTEPYPARAAVEVAAFPIDIGVEIEVVARTGEC